MPFLIYLHAITYIPLQAIFRSRETYLNFLKMDNLEIGSGVAGVGSTIEAAKEKPQSALEQALLVRSMTLLHSTLNH